MHGWRATLHGCGKECQGSQSSSASISGFSPTQLSHRHLGQCVWTNFTIIITFHTHRKNKSVVEYFRFRPTEFWRTSAKILYFVFGYSFLAGPSASQGPILGVARRLYHQGTECKIHICDSP